MPNLRVAWRLAERAPPPVLSPAAGRAFERVGDALEHLIELISAEMIADARVKREASAVSPRAWRRAVLNQPTQELTYD